ncbi:MAG: EAL domain-containing protein [Acidobacteria bacterium]|nr:EAL domain-containing protein [Acidobacteriota bacterium]
MYSILIVEDDPIVAEGVAMSLAEPGRRIIVCHDTETGSMQVEQDRIDVVIADIRYGGNFCYRGLEFVSHVLRESPGTQVILMSGDGSDALAAEAIRRGASGFLRKPFQMSELEKLLRAAPGFSETSAIIHVPSLDEVLEGDMLYVNFQPIVSLADRRIIGFEALARISTDSILRNPENLFQYAERAGRMVDLESNCLARAIHEGKDLSDRAMVFLNVHPCSFEKPRIVSTVMNALDAASVAPERIVLEITEQGAIRSSESIRQITELKSLGVEFALDDIGVAFSHLPYIEDIAPRWIKISQLFGTGFETDPTKIKIVQNLAALAKSFDADLILEGVETEETAMAATDAGIVCAQGYYFARPPVVEHWCNLTSDFLPAIAVA